VASSGWLLLALLALSAGSGPARADVAVAGAAAPAGVAALDTSRAPTDGHWVVIMRSGEAVWRQQGSAMWRSLQVGQVVPPQSEIETGPDGALILVVGGDRLALDANSRLILPAREPGQDQRLRHEHGRLRFDVERRAGRKVEVRTPLLSLGIKGTSLEVAVDRRQNSVLVLEGMVEVTPPGGREAIDLGPRQGWRQPVEPRVPPSRLEAADLPAVVDHAEPVRWHLPDSDLPDATEAPWSMRPTGAPQTESWAGELRERSGAPSGAGGGQGWLGTWIDHDTSLITILMIAGAGLVILIVPALMLGQNLRAQWQSRPAGKGRRRRSLIHG
jgi:hypothetical protein